MTDLEKNKALVRRYFDLSNAGRIDEYVAMLSDDFRLVGMGMPDSTVNHDMSKADLEANARAYENKFKERITIALDRLVAEGDTVVAMGRSRALTANGVAYANNYSFAFSFRDGLVAEIREYCCTWSVVHVLREKGVQLTTA